MDCGIEPIPYSVGFCFVGRAIDEEKVNVKDHYIFIMKNYGPITHFSKKVQSYIKYRPNYPHELLLLMEQEMGLNKESMIADIGSGTGILTGMFIANGNLTYAVEPNNEMRYAADEMWGFYPNYRSTIGRAEETHLASNVIDFITAGQAFHWFDPVVSRAEFNRILKPGGWCVLVWNNRIDQASGFMEGYEAFLQEYAENYDTHHHRVGRSETIDQFFSPNEVHFKAFANQQRFDLNGLLGRYFSSSYSYDDSHPDHESAKEKLTNLFDQYQKEGKVTMLYQTEIYFGQLL